MATNHYHFAAKIKLGLSLRVKTSKNWMMGGCLGLDIKLPVIASGNFSAPIFIAFRTWK